MYPNHLFGAPRHIATLDQRSERNFDRGLLRGVLVLDFLPGIGAMTEKIIKARFALSKHCSEHPVPKKFVVDAVVSVRKPVMDEVIFQQ